MVSLLLLPILLFLALFSCQFSPAFGEQRIVEQPEDTVARIGDNVVLRCRVADQKGQVIWMQGDIGLGYKRDLPFWERMRMVGSQNEGEYHLEIRNVSLEDEEYYQCQLSSTDEEPVAKLSRRAKLTIMVEPQPPVLLGETFGTGALQRTQPIGGTEGRPVRLSCASRGGKPVARLGWAVAEDWEAQRLVGHISNGTEPERGEKDTTDTTTTTGTVITVHPIRAREHLHHQMHRPPNRQLFGLISEEVMKDEDTQLYTVTSHLTFTPTKAENGRWMVCLAAHESYGRDSRSASVRLDVNYAPKVRVEVIPEGSQYNEGGHVRLSCASDARPDDVKMNWSWDGDATRMELIDQSVLIKGLRFSDNGQKVTCTVHNQVGTGIGVFELDVPYGPRFMSTNQTKIVERGGQATFQCEAIGNPTPTIRWYHGRDTETPIYEGKNYTINNAQDWEEGEYRCTAEVDGFPSRTLHHALFLRGPPKVQLADDFTVEDGSVTLSCKVQHRTERVKIHWYHNGRRVDMEPGGGLTEPDERRYLVRDERLNRWELVSRLTIARFADADFGTYNCTARNEHGVVSDQRQIAQLGPLDKLKRYAHQLPLEAKIGVGAAVLLLALIILISCFCCCICRCRRRRCGHSKFSNQSKSSGSINIKQEPLYVPDTANSTSPLYTQQHYLTDQEIYFHEPAKQLFTANTMDPSVIQYPAPNPAQGYLPNGVGNGHIRTQQYSTDNSSFIVPNGHSPSGYQPYPVGNGGNGSTFMTQQQQLDIYDQHHHSRNPSMNSFGMAPGPAPCSYSPHLQPQQSQQQQQYCFTSPSPLEPVTEVCTPESVGPGDGMGMGMGMPNMAQQQRSVSRDSTLV